MHRRFWRWFGAQSRLVLLRAHFAISHSRSVARSERIVKWETNITTGGGWDAYARLDGSHGNRETALRHSPASEDLRWTSALVVHGKERAVSIYTYENDGIAGTDLRHDVYFFNPLDAVTLPSSSPTYLPEGLTAVGQGTHGSST